MNTKNIVKGVGLALAIAGLLTIVASHPVLVAMVVIGVCSYYVVDKIL